MKKLLMLLLPISAFGQIVCTDGLCSAPATQDGQAGTVQFSGTFIPDVLPPPPPPAENIVAFGDSYCDTNRGQTFPGYLAQLRGVSVDNNCNAGDTSGEILDQVQDYVQGNVDTDAMHVFWLLPNDFNGTTNPFWIQWILNNRVQPNLYAAFSELQSVGVSNIVILDLFAGEYLPRSDNMGISAEDANAGMQLIENAYIAAANQAGITVFSAGAVLDPIGDNLCFQDDVHLCTSEHLRLAEAMDAAL